MASEPRERARLRAEGASARSRRSFSGGGSAPAPRRARERAGESEGRSPSDEFDELQSLAATVDAIAARLLTISDQAASAPRAPGKWSPKQVIGHLIDSAINNHVRFVRAQLQDDLVFSGYDQDGWVRVRHYDEQRWEDIVEAWRACNHQIAAIIRTTSAADLNRPRLQHNLHEIGFQPLPPGADATLGFLMRDYVAHLHHHVRQVLGA